ncbi:1-deoxy-D-xylulose-5-phosphate synthase [Striga asiatica]|uniref:1-deoxy-D-xylulose-5-phosphate synthase n=1 Tax=Striga asiatica TaxID=4170 RepID=A0A5A7PKY3_STRAF|nr:1-deoxy-D-xylulose-5-phosphate synthase [Striga asiatica]
MMDILCISPLPLTFYSAICEQHATTHVPSDKYDDVAQHQPFFSYSVQRATDEMQSDVIRTFQTSRSHPAHQTIARSFCGTIALDRGTLLRAAMDHSTRHGAWR